MKQGDLVRFLDPNGEANPNTLGIVLGFHENKGSVKIQWFKMTAICPEGQGYWPWGILKVVSESR